MGTMNGCGGTKVPACRFFPHRGHELVLGWTLTPCPQEVQVISIFGTYPPFGASGCPGGFCPPVNHRLTAKQKSRPDFLGRLLKAIYMTL